MRAAAAGWMGVEKRRKKTTKKGTSLGAIVPCPVYYLRCFVRRMFAGAENNTEMRRRAPKIG